MPNDITLGDEYFYEDSTSDALFSYSPTNYLDVSRLLKNKAPWKKADEARIRKKKTLILHIPNAEDWDGRGRLAVADRIGQLQKRGFKVYTLGEQGSENTLIFKTFNPELVDMHETFSLFTSSPISKEALIRKAVEELELSHDALHIIDPEELDTLIHGNIQLYSAKETFTHLDLHQSGIEEALLTELLEQRAHSLLSLNLAECHYLGDEGEELPETLHLPHLKELILSNSKTPSPFPFFNFKNKNRWPSSTLSKDSISRLVSSTEELAHLDIDSCDINPLILNLIKKPEKIETLNLGSCSIEPHSFSNFLKKAINLKKLDLRDVQLDLKDLHNIIPSTITELDLSGTSISWTDLVKIMNKTPNIKVLKLSNCTELDTGWISTFEQWKWGTSLEELDLSNSPINGSTYSLILSNPKLKKLNLSKSNTLGFTLLNNFAFETKSTLLEELDLSGQMVNLESLSQLLIRNPNLKILKLNECRFRDAFPNRINLDSLEELHFSGNKINSDSNRLSTSIDAKHLENLILSASNLKKLNLSECKQFPIGENFSFNTFPPSLEDLDLTDIYTLDFNYLDTLKKITTLKVKFNALTSTLEDSRLIPYLKGQDASSENIDISQVETLDLRKTQGAIRLEQLIEKIPRMNQLFIDDTFSITIDPQNEPALCFQFLEDLTYLKTDPVLLNFLLKSPLLKRLHVNEIAKPFDLAAHPLEQLSINTRWDGGHSILKKAPQLKKLHWSKFDTVLSNQKITEVCELTSLENLTLFSASIDMQSLSNILAGTPQLTTLNLEYCHYLNVHFKITLPNLPVLHTLNLPGSDISTYNLTQLLSKTPQITKLNLNGCTGLTELPESLNLSTLEELSISETLITPEWLRKFLKRAPNLKVLDITKCPHIKTLPEELSRPSLKVYQDEEKKTSPEITEKESKEWQANHGVPGQHRNKLEQEGQNRPVLADADTAPDASPQQFDVTKLFYSCDEVESDPSVTLYRIHFFDTLEINRRPCSMQEAFSLLPSTKDKALKIITHSLTQSAEDTYNKTKLEPQNLGHHRLYSKQELILTDSWKPLVSSSPQELMKSYHTHPAVDIDIAYSETENRYYVRLKEPKSTQNITLDFIVEIPTTPKPTWPKDILDKLDECQHFQAKALEDTPPNATGADYLALLQKQKVGACRHRTIVFKEWMNTNHPHIPTRIIRNECHEFIELYANNQWHTYNLGGYPGRLNIHEPHSLEDHPKEEEVQLDEQGIEVPSSVVSETEQKTKKAEAMEPGPTTSPAPAASDTTKSEAEKPRRYFLKPQAPKPPASADEYIQHLLSSKPGNQLIHLDDSNNLHALRFALQNYCKRTSRPCFYIHSPEDLVCASAYIKQKGKTGTMMKGPGGPLHDFLTNKSIQGKKPLIIVNYDQFTPRDIVRCNSLIDAERQADGTAVPSDALIIGLRNPNNLKAYNGLDFLSRFDEKPTSCPLSEDALAPLSEIPTAPSEPAPGTKVIELYGGASWEEQLMGAWSLSGTKLQFIDGALTSGLTAHQSIELRNAPWNDPEFVLFIQEAQMQGILRSPHGTIPLPEGITFTQSTGYAWKALHEAITRIQEAPEHLPESLLVLNPTLLPLFFKKMHCDNRRHQMTTHLPGILEEHHHQSINLYLSAPLSLHDWARFLDACKTHHVQCTLYLAPGVTLPAEINPNLPPSPKKEIPAWNRTHIPSGDFALSSTDMDVALHDLPADVIIDVSELEYSHLGKRIHVQKNPNDLRPLFTEQTGALLHALEAGKRVVLKGHYSPTIRDSLNELILSRQQAKRAAKGQLILLSEEPLFPLLPSWEQKVTVEDKKRILGPAPFSAPEYRQQSLARLRAMKGYKTRHPTGNAQDTWLGMEHLPPSSESGFTTTEAFDEERMTAVTQVLNHSPFVFLAGKTGVGKTTFVQNIWKKAHPALHYGESALKDWALDRRAGLKVLFLDEANISQRQWSEFEGLFHNPPGIMVDNEFIHLSPQHKIIFAGNPLSYGGERSLPALFARHGNSVIFKPLPPEYLYQQLLQPLLGIESNWDGRALAQPILRVAQFFNECSPDKVLISPRELSMMALLTLSYCRRHKEAMPQEVANYYAYHLSKSLVPKTHQDAFSALWQPIPTLLHSTEKQPKQCTLTFANRPAFQALTDVLELRALRQKEEHSAQGSKLSTLLQQKPALFSGLGGLIIEGEPGLGKSELVISTLLAHGLKKGAPNREHPGEQVFYVFSHKMSIEDKESLLIKAFHEGAVVIIDEINSSPRMEKLLNDLLMGTAPGGHPAKAPGFTLIGTQNPPARAGRALSSLALQRRMHTVVIPEYSKDEMIEIVTKKGLSPHTATQMVDEYIQFNKEASKEEDALCFRDLDKRAKQEIRALNTPKEEVQAVQKARIEQPIAESSKAKPKVLSLPEKIKNLQAEIDSLKSYGEQLVSKGNKKEGEKALQCAKTLHTLSAPCFDSSIPSKERMQHRKDFTDALDSSYQKLKTHRSFFSSCLSAIARAFRACFGGKPVLSQGSFFDDTTRQRQVRKIAKVWDAKEAKSPK